ncbi:MAG: hypothetical protein RRC34_12320 [Lentisphaeria bacterium]|nr:hypothetical protein [Lentisphaeria bacterium]
MLKKLIAKVEHAVENALKGRAGIDPAQFNDPVADQTSWSPLKSGGTNFCTHKMKRTAKTRIEFKTTLGAKLFSGLFAAIGLSILIGGGFTLTATDKAVEPGAVIFLGLFGAVFALVGCGLYWSMSTPTVLDASLGLYWKGRKDPTLPSNRDAMKICVELAEIHAIQLLAEYCRGSGKNSSSYWSYELNFVLHSGDRVNVVDHGNLTRIRNEAAQLADLLKLPVWDAA